MIPLPELLHNAEAIPAGEHDIHDDAIVGLAEDQLQGLGSIPTQFHLIAGFLKRTIKKGSGFLVVFNYQNSFGHGSD